MIQYLQDLFPNVDAIIVLLVLMSGFFQERYLRGFKISKDSDLDGALKTLIVSGIFSVIYIVLLMDESSRHNWSKYFLSYVSATSLYQLVIGPFVKFIKKWIAKVTGTTDTSDPVKPPEPTTKPDK